MAAIIGKTLMDSGAAERIVRAFRSVTGENQSEYALMGSSYVLSIPVFFDNVFFLLAPLGRSMKAKTGVKFSLYISVLCAGALATHMLVPPTPGPLAMADSLDVDLGLALLLGASMALPTSLFAGIVYGRFLHNREEFPLREAMGSTPESLEQKAERRPRIYRGCSNPRCRSSFQSCLSRPRRSRTPRWARDHSFATWPRSSAIQISR